MHLRENGPWSKTIVVELGQNLLNANISALGGLCGEGSGAGAHVIVSVYKIFGKGVTFMPQIPGSKVHDYNHHTVSPAA